MAVPSEVEVHVNFFLQRPQEENGTKASDTSECVSFVDEAIARQKKLPRLFAQRLSRMAVTLASITFVVTLVVTVMAFLSWKTSDSSVSVFFAVDSVFTSWSSFMIIWRFCSSQSTVTVCTRKETIATLMIAASLVMSAACIYFRAYQSLQEGEKPTQLIFILVLAASSCLAYLLLFLAKYKIALRMGSEALTMSDAINALSGGMLPFSLVISSILMKCSVIDVWYFDLPITIVIAAFSVCYGATVLICLIAVHKDCKNAISIDFYLQ